MASSKVALVTGVSSGIGRSMAQALAARGHRVLGTAREVERAEAAPGVELVRLDVSRPDSIRACAAEVLERAGRVDVLVNNAGQGLLGGVEETDVDQARALFETNFFGLMGLTAAVLPGMRARRSGAIVNVSSVLGLFAVPFQGVYAATKHAVEAYTEALHYEVGPMGIRVILVEPGFTRTRFGEASRGPLRPLAAYDGPRNRARRIVRARVASGASPEVVARTAVRALEASRHSLRHPAGREASVLRLVRRLVPAWAFERSVRSQFEVDGRAEEGPARRAS